ncbi:hypothetical protein BN2127_JRS10_02385 [Bacillus subtilis]|nr:hypothetical protein BN2127_JRS10_02385 [Bacillus subtilis]
MPRGMPRAGSTSLVGIPLIVTLFGMKVVPTGIESVKMIFVSSTVCKFWNVTVYVMISSISTLFLSDVFAGLIMLLMISVLTGGVVSVSVIGGSFGLG